jgi:hypothetical protein
VEQVLINLVLNARDAMPSGGRVTLETADAVSTVERPLEDLAPGEYVALCVTDTGHGIPEALRTQIFEPFFTTKEVGRGTGLGLSMVAGIVRQSGGAIRLETTEGGGTTFTVYLPRATAAPHVWHEVRPVATWEPQVEQYMVSASRGRPGGGVRSLGIYRLGARARGAKLSLLRPGHPKDSPLRAPFSTPCG